MEKEVYFHVSFDSEEWEALSKEDQTRVLAKLKASADPLAQQLYSALQALIQYLEEENKIDFDATYDYYYGDEDEDVSID